MKNSKKILITCLLTAVLAMLLAFSASAACAHKNIVKVASKSVKATCTTAGYDWYRCKDCGKNGDTVKALKKTVKAKGHTKVLVSSKSVKPTCTKAGYNFYKCKVCGKTGATDKTLKVTVAKLGHKYSTKYTVDKKATCTTKGSKSQHCVRCAAKRNVTAIPAKGHTRVKVASKCVAPTCTKAGYDFYRCKVCKKTGDTDKTLKVTLAKLGHKYSTKYTVDKKATCTAKGSKSQHCVRCAAKRNVTAIPAKGHTKVKVASKSVAPTCTTAGYDFYKCKVCGKTGDTDASLKVTVAKLGHKYAAEYTVDKEPTCTAKGSKSQHCERCDAKRRVTAIKAKGHTKVLNEEKSLAPTCVSDGFNWYSCPACGKDGDTLEALKVAVPALGHDTPVDIRIESDVICARCGKVAMPAFNTLVNAVTGENCGTVSRLIKETDSVDKNSVSSTIKFNKIFKAAMDIMGEKMSEDDIVNMLKEEVAKEEPTYSGLLWKGRVFYSTYPLPYEEVVSRLTDADVVSATVTDVSSIDFINEIPDNAKITLNNNSAMMYDMAQFKELGGTTGNIKKISVNLVTERYSSIKDSDAETALMRATGLDIRTLPERLAIDETDDPNFDLTMNCTDIVSNAVIDYYFLVTYDENEDATYKALGSKYETNLTISEKASMSMVMNLKQEMRNAGISDLLLITIPDKDTTIMSGDITMDVTQTTDEYYLFAPAE